MTMNEFLDQYIVRENDEIGYLAQTQLLDQIPQLANEIDRPIYSYLHVFFLFKIERIKN